MSVPKVSVIMPVHNSGEFLKKSAESVLCQTFPDLELILIDDFSNDESPSVIRSLCNDDRRVTALNFSENVGAAVARNAGIKKSSGKYIAFLDSDDFWDPTKLEKQVKFMQETQAAFSHTGFRRVSESTGRNLSEYIPPEQLSYHDMLYSNKIGCLTAMFDTASIGRVTMPNIRKRQDYAMWLKILRETELVHGLQETLASYTVREGSISSNKFSLLKYNYSVFRDCEEFSRTASLYYLFANVLSRIQRGSS